MSCAAVSEPRRLIEPCAGRSPILTSISFSRPSRTISSSTVSPGSLSATRFLRSRVLANFLPSISTTTSPCCNPASSAGVSSSIWDTRTPSGLSIFNASASSSVRSWIMTPSHPRTTFPPLMRSSMTRPAMLMGMANPIPWYPPDWETIAVLMPTTSPSRFTSGPPLLPGLMAASVWMKFSYSASLTSVRPRAETIPAVTEYFNPNGFPTANTQLPTRSLSESPSVAVGRSSPSILMTARSVSGSVPTICASKVRLSGRVTLISSASPTT